MAQLELIGWKEIASLPDLKMYGLKSKIDSGAKSSTLHAEEIQYTIEDGVRYVKFKIHSTSSEEKTKFIKAKLIEERKIKSSTGHITIRPVILTTLNLGSHFYEIELTLLDRNFMGLKLLIGRDALKNKFIIHPGKVNLLGSKKK